MLLAVLTHLNFSFTIQKLCITDALQKKKKYLSIVLNSSTNILTLLNQDTYLKSKIT